MAILESVHLGERIARPAGDVYDYVSRPQNLGAWAQGLAAGFTREGDDWVGEGPMGRVRVRFAERNELGVLDHYVTGPDGSVTYVPLRVIANGEGSAIVLTVFRPPGASDEAFERDLAAVRRDLGALKQTLEAKRP